MKNLINETIEFMFTAQSKAKLMQLLSENFKQRRVDSLIILEDLEKDDSDKLEGEENYNVKK